MRLRRRDKNVPELNTTSTADISFMLLVFFLVTTSMYEAKGLIARLPPKDNDEKEKKEIIVDKNNIMALAIDADWRTTANGHEVAPDSLRHQMTELMLSKGRDHLVTSEANPEGCYEAYFQLQQAITGAYNDARETKAQRDYGRSLRQLTSDDREKVLTAIPQRIAEDFNTDEPTTAAAHHGTAAPARNRPTNETTR